MKSPSPAASRLLVLVAEDHPAMREGLATLLEQQPGLRVAGHAGSARETVELVRNTPADVLVMDLMLDASDGIALIRELRGLAPALKIVIFSLHSEEIYAERCLRAGARGYVMKRESVETLVRAIRQVAAGEIAVSSRVAAAVLARVAGQGGQAAGAEAQLTDRELQVFRLVGLAMSTREIATKLGVSVKTVETHRENIKNKLGLENAAALTARAARWISESAGNLAATRTRS